MIATAPKRFVKRAFTGMVGLPPDEPNQNAISVPHATPVPVMTLDDELEDYLDEQREEAEDAKREEIEREDKLRREERARRLSQPAPAKRAFTGLTGSP